MAYDSKPVATNGPLGSLITAAQNGQLSVSYSTDVTVNADEFALIERDCVAMKAELRKLQVQAQSISDQSNWGLGENEDRLISAKTLVPRLRSKAAKVNSSDSDNNLFDIFQKHYRIVDDYQNLHKEIAQQYCAQDEQFAAEYRKLLANAPASPIGKTTTQPGVTPGIGLS
ncbi:hypothetical protein [Nocardia macrotermitis]|uniref:Uncharacterized protein n=1 Tax=Nocardia macrotermitis TaxID=2585198 RepID=A0A7K0D547_9NOCA|nr:hypothetical protein [Nocardia macrotermitis]MQY20442.1 hypothetical protein [Nocardia macrotermitis]